MTSTLGIDALGYVASALVLATFSMRGLTGLRVVAIASNIAFIGYGALADLAPVLGLHVLLLPMNCLRLHQAMKFVGLSASAPGLDTPLPPAPRVLGKNGRAPVALSRSDAFRQSRTNDTGVMRTDRSCHASHGFRAPIQLEDLSDVRCERSISSSLMTDSVSRRRRRHFSFSRRTR